jgi:large subunit ribosomal protein L29
MKILDVRNLTDSELVTRKKEARQEYFNLRLQQQTGALERPSRLNELRKDVAKLETVLSERRLGLKIQSRTGKKPAVEKSADAKNK